MNIEFCPLGNGACPFCKKHNKCVLQENIKESVYNFKKSKTDNALEIVIYNCSEFVSSIEI